jgi:predicted enzyme related to lactoylglutathione lyase
MSHPVVHFEVVGKDGPKLQEFYRQLFDWKLEPMEPAEMGYAMVRDAGIGGGIGAAPAGSPGHLTFYVQVPDLQAALSKAEQLGGKTVVPVTEMEMVTFAMFTDPEGHMVGLVKG